LKQINGGTMRFALVGIGNIAPVHARAIQDTPGAELVAVATRDEARGRAFVAEHGGVWFADYQEMLAHAGADAVSLCPNTAACGSPTIRKCWLTPAPMP